MCHHIRLSKHNVSLTNKYLIVAYFCVNLISQEWEYFEEENVLQVNLIPRNCRHGLIISYTLDLTSRLKLLRYVYTLPQSARLIAACKCSFTKLTIILKFACIIALIGYTILCFLFLQHLFQSRK